MPGIGVLRSESLNPLGFVGESPGAARLRLVSQLETLRLDGIVVDGLVKALGLQSLKVVSGTKPEEVES